MPKSNHPDRGLRDWVKKKPIIKDVLGAFSDKDIFDIVYPEKKDSTRATQLADASRRWHLHKPERQADFFNRLALKLGCIPGVTGKTIADANVAEFIDMLPERCRARARRLASAEMTNQPAIPADINPLIAPERIVHVCHKNEQQTISSGVRAGIIDTSNYYSAADATETWRNLVSAEAYPTYNQCKAGLRQLMDEPSWQNTLATASPTTAVMLAGGGAPTKDLVLLRGLLKQSTNSAVPITMLLVDINPHMLLQSMAFLERAKETLDGHERVNFKYAVADILELGQLIVQSPPVFQRNGRAVFAITGGTIGNLSEQKFFQSLELIAKSGDVLIVSADTVDHLPPDQLEARLTKKYNHLEMRRMIMPGVVAVLNEFNLNESVEDALKRVKVRVRPSETGKLSDVPSSWNVTLVLTAAAKQEIILLNSTRYSAKSLEEFAMQFGWEFVCKVPSPQNLHFVQFSFRRK